MNNAITQGAANDIALGKGGSYSLSRDVLAHQIWDTRYFDNAAISSYTFFSQQINAPWWGNTVKSKNETNLSTAGQLPVSQTFLIKRIGVGLIVPFAASADYGSEVVQAFTNIMQSSVFEIRIAGREFDFQLHGRQFLPSVFVNAVDGGALTNTRVGDMIASGWVSLRDTPIFLDQQVNFSVFQQVGNPLQAISTILAGNSTSLYAYYATMQVTLEGTLTRGK